MQTYTTQMDAARKGIITPQMEIVAKKEYRTTEEIRQWVAEGKVAIPANKHHECLNPEGVGSMLRTKINVNLGVSRDCKDYNVEMQKVMSAVNMGAEAIMDLSSHGPALPPEADPRVPGDDRHRAGVRFGHPLPARSG
mgnify:CR=1 FL=1